MSAFTAVVTSYNIDNDERRVPRWFETILQAVVSMIGALIVYVQLTDLCAGISDADCAPSLVRVLSLAAITGQ